jgi:UDP-hydrolysing UDP-N-acetyl-D-glucosamine 2-epimerase
MRHAVTKLSHLHLVATKQSAERVRRLGEEEHRIVHVGSPGVEGIREDAAADASSRYGVTTGNFVLFVLHPTRDDDAAERATAQKLLDALQAAGESHVVAVLPNNDPGNGGIREALAASAICRTYADVPRTDFLGLLRDCRFLIGNSSAGIIESASLGTPVIDVGPRQYGRERSDNVVRVDLVSVGDAIDTLARSGWSRYTGASVYELVGRRPSHEIMSAVLSCPTDAASLRKTITY